MGFKVYSFEPAPSNYKMLAASIQANIDEGLFQASGESSVYLVPAGAGATEDSNTIYSEVGNYGNSIILPKNKDGQADGSKPGDILSIGLAEGGKFLAQEIHTVPIDTVVKERISYMKMDCQGYEIFALEGATTLFDTYGVDQVFFEYAPNWIVSVGRKPTEMLEFFDRHGYVIYNKGSKLAPEEFHSLTVGLGSSFTDLVAYSKKAYPDKA
ncbi:S-adenosyl-L-methionine-dependent methyltransferase [Entophlyctis helioformis]|nr:S-adenosyl-L-methionine-dependent methyltransferase [Entophlyctis helioformis]KAI8923703.1 S-adenosyl-L-methionine-dependent methyltransferase [Entophlyctis helioformis]